MSGDGIAPERAAALGDDDLLESERRLGEEYRRLGRLEPATWDASYRVLHGSPELLRAWESWSRARIEAAGRGLLFLARHV